MSNDALKKLDGRAVSYGARIKILIGLYARKQLNQGIGFARAWIDLSSSARSSATAGLPCAAMNAVPHRSIAR